MLAVTKLSLLLDAACGALALLTILCLAPWAAGHVLRDSQGVTVLLLAGLAYAIQYVATDTALGVLRAFSRFRTLATVEVSGALFKLAAALTAVYALGAGVIGVLWALVATSLLVNGALLTLALMQLRRRVSLRAPAPLALLRPCAPEMRRFLTHNYLISLSNMAWTDLDVTLVGYFISKEAVGVYKVAKSFAVAMSQAMDAVFLVVYPELARLWTQREFARLKEIILRLSGAMLAGAAVLYAAAFFAVPWLAPRLLRPEFGEAGTVFRCMGWGIILSAPFVWVYPYLMAAGRTDLNLWTAWSSTVIVVALYLAAIPAGGMIGAALVNAGSVSVFTVIGLALARRNGLLFPASDGRIPRA